MRDNTLNEMRGGFLDNMKKAESRCREMGSAQSVQMWSVIAAQLAQMRKNGEIMINQRAQTRAQVLETLDIMHGKAVESENEKKVLQ